MDYGSPYHIIIHSVHYTSLPLLYSISTGTHATIFFFDPNHDLCAVRPSAVVGWDASRERKGPLNDNLVDEGDNSVT
jgi:hypothetical protein